MDGAAIAAYDEAFAVGGVVPEDVDFVAAVGGAFEGVEGDTHRERIDDEGAVVLDFHTGDVAQDDVDPPGVHVVVEAAEGLTDQGMVLFVSGMDPVLIAFLDDHAGLYQTSVHSVKRERHRLEVAGVIHPHG